MSEKVTLLYVDDEPTNLLLFEHSFNKKFDILTAESGSEGLDLLKSNTNTRVVISDMRMPEMSGLEFIQKAKQEFPDLCYYILTGYEVSEEITKALNEKVIKNCFNKPFNRVEIENTILETLKN